MLAGLILAASLVTSCYDGDTCTLAGGERIRLMGIDAPEIGPPRVKTPEPCAVEARDTLRALVLNRHVDLERHGRDRYGRTLAFVTIQGQDASTALLTAGLARTLPGYWLPAGRFNALAFADGRAQFVRAGIWGGRCNKP